MEVAANLMPTPKANAPIPGNMLSKLKCCCISSSAVMKTAWIPFTRLIFLLPSEGTAAIAASNSFSLGKYPLSN
ncbi:hypothetical protein DAPPUDRAFT_301946 [Daphnia pulex]|uniref:Uncharacterized protein n=1 Tax=Daphnia pulex TaxID=6669 RepID=E9GAY1_DAPPU|nr:hypothetical protein DAPPUDRAFT_301946 [Daphnia pulex]|eukprot:EFX83338.1 hypothetical protein DAPPUDRAFT_301946 [Daphnia pulex]